MCRSHKWEFFRSGTVEDRQARSEGGAEGAPAPPPPIAELKGPQFEQPFVPDS